MMDGKYLELLVEGLSDKLSQVRLLTQPLVLSWVVPGVIGWWPAAKLAER